MTAVIVKRAPFGDRTTFAMAEAIADCFHKDTVEVRCSDIAWDAAWGPLEIFQPGSWLEAKVVDERGNILYTWLSELGKAAS